MRTIAAIATPLQKSPIHIIRISGPDTFKIINKILEKKVREDSHTIQRNKIIYNKEIVDDVLLNIFCNPKSYTGEDLVEINCHGNPLLTKKILNLLIKNGCEYAKPGEFSMQALINNKLNYYEIEATNNLINANNEIASKYAINSIVGKDLDEIKKIRDQIFQIVGSVEVNIDYPEYDDVPQLSHKDILNIVNNLIKKLEKIFHDSKIISPIFNGLKVAIIGKPNVGKSSLFNFLLKQDKAIVSNISGTTRDIIESDIQFDLTSIKLLDTAGIRKTKNKIENFGISKTIESIKEADLIIWLTNSKEENDNDELKEKLKGKKYIKVYNKSDVYGKTKNEINISVKNNDVNDLIKAIKKHIEQICPNKNNELILQSDRQINILEKVILILKDLTNDLKESKPLDLLQTDFETCINLVDKIIGQNIEFDKLDELFKHFCLGK